MLNSRTFTLVFATSLSLLAGACTDDNSSGGDARTGFGKALPSAAEMRIPLPSSDGQRTALVGETASYYAESIAVVTSVNATTAELLAGIDAILAELPTSEDVDGAVWGAPLDEADGTRLTVTTAADGSYQWKLIVAGVEHASGQARADGSGTLRVDLSAAAGDDDTGRYEINYDLESDTQDIVLDTTEAGVAERLEYHYRGSADGAGDLTLAIRADAGDPGGQPELTALRTRWIASGAGRADARISGGDLTAPITASECWDATFSRVYFEGQADWQDSEGDVADCAFASALLP
jgi:hypothetical protein